MKKIILISLALFISATGSLSFAQEKGKLFSAGLKIVDFTYKYADGSEETLTTAIWYPSDEKEEQYRYTAAGDGKYFESKVALDGRLAKSGAPYPLIIFSHGLYGSGNGSAFFTEYLARHGYIVASADYTDTLPPDYKQQAAFVRLKEGNAMPVAEGLLAAKRLADYMSANRKDLMAYLARYRLSQPSFILDSIIEMNNDPGSFLYKSIIPEAIGMCGHSLGGTTTMAKVGAYPGGEFKDKRIKAALILSSPAYPFEETVSNIGVPVMFMAGDNDEPGLRPDIPRMTLYDKAGPPKFYLVLVKATHYSFTNSVCGAAELFQAVERVPQAQVIAQYGLAFFDRYLLSDKSAGKWIKDSGLTSAQLVFHDIGRE
jgi:predicted dienelactone hydrolase